MPFPCFAYSSSMKKFLYSFLGAMAAIWLSVIIGGLLIVFTIISFAGSLLSETPEIKPKSVLRISLSGTVVDQLTQPTITDFLSEGFPEQVSLSDLIGSIKRASSDDNIEGILFEFDQPSVGLAQCEEIREAVDEFKKTGKWVLAYADNYSQGAYYIATSADEVMVNPVGMVDIHGLSATTFYFKELLDKLGIEAQVVKVGTFKSAVEPFMLNDMSEANREQLSHFLGRMWTKVSSDIASARSVTSDSVNSWANDFEFSKSAETYLSQKVVDKAAYQRMVDEMVALRTDAEKPGYVELAEYTLANTFSPKISKKDSKNIAILYAEGDITENERGGIASSRMVPQILELADDESLDGLILRVNSGGGSAFASEQIWEALKQFKEKTGKPFYVSMGNVAASGGYYISCGADKIFASPLTLTGSIGIFGVIPSLQGLLSGKVGVNTATVATNTGEFPTIFKNMTPAQREAMQGYVDRGYDLFVNRCAQSRGLPFDSIAAVAQGRVWDGQSALECGLVDELGSLNATIKAMAQELGTDIDGVRISTYPEIDTQWWTMLSMIENSSQTKTLMEFIATQSDESMSALTKAIMNISPLQCRMDFMLIR